MHYIACNSRCHVHVEHTYSYFVNIWFICTWHLVCKRNPRSGKRSDRRPASSHGSTSNFNQRSDKRSNCNKELADDLIDKFQSTLQRTERPEDKIINAVAHISIHAPANGATHSNSHMPDSAEFQSTLRRTERLESKAGWKGLCNFNPRSGERSDRCSWCWSKCI